MQPGRPRRTRSLSIVLAVLAGAGLAGDAAQAFIKLLVSPSARPKFIEVGLDYKE